MLCASLGHVDLPTNDSFEDIRLLRFVEEHRGSKYEEIVVIVMMKEWGNKIQYIYDYSISSLVLADFLKYLYHAGSLICAMIILFSHG